MLLYTETQLGRAYKAYQRHQIKQDLAFMTLENFRFLFEDIQITVLEGVLNEIQYD
tara:strand:+ start:407 stop:574 length:168 start_codon:yes stop_codon:yes gene_type:complete